MKIDNSYKSTVQENPNKQKFVYIPKRIWNKLGIMKGTLIRVDITIIEPINLLCRCYNCGKKSVSISNDIYCKHCGSDDMQVLEEDVIEK